MLYSRNALIKFSLNGDKKSCYIAFYFLFTVEKNTQNTMEKSRSPGYV